MDILSRHVPRMYKAYFCAFMCAGAIGCATYCEGYWAWAFLALGVQMFIFGLAEAVMMCWAEWTYDILQLSEPAPIPRLDADDVKIFVNTNKYQSTVARIDQNSFREIAGALLVGNTLAEEQWRKRGFSIRKLREIKSELLKRGILIPKGTDPRQGFVVSRAGLSALRYAMKG
jgi:hypothetical protein